MARTIVSTSAAGGLATPGSAAFRQVGLPVLSLLLLLLAWQLAATLAGNPRLMPAPAAVFSRLLEETASGDLPYHLAVTLVRVVLSFVLAMSIGTALGILLGRSRLADSLGQPWLVFFLNLPALVTIVLAYIWIGLTEAAAITAVALNKIPNVMVTVREGSRALDTGLLDMAAVFELPRGRRLRHVILPQALRNMIPALLTQFIVLLKDTSLASIIGYVDLTKAAQIVNNREIRPFELYLFIAIVYWLCSYAMSRYAQSLESRLASR